MNKLETWHKIEICVDIVADREGGGGGGDVRDMGLQLNLQYYITQYVFS